MKSYRNGMFVLYCLVCWTIGLGNALKTVKDTDIPELSFMDLTADPCDDFYEYSCGNYAKLHPLGKERVVDEYSVLTQKIIKLMINILENANSTSDSEAVNKVKTAFDACLNLKVTDSRKPYPEVSFLSEVGGMPLFQTPKTQNTFGWREIGQLTSAYGIPLLFKITVIAFPITEYDNLIRVEEDTFQNPNIAPPSNGQYLLEILSSDLQSYITELDAPFGIFLRKIFTILRKHINVDVTDEDLNKGITEIIKFVKDIQGAAGIPQNSTIKPLTTTTVIGDLQQWTNEQFDNHPPIDWIEYLDAVFSEAGVKMTNTTNIFVNSTYVYNVLNVVKNTPPDVVKNFILMRLLLFSAMDSHWEIRNTVEEFYRENQLTIYSRDEYCVRQLIDIDQSDTIVGLSLASGRLFAEYDNGKTRLSKTREMVADLSKTFVMFLSNSQWMDASSKSSAFDKVKKMVDLIGLPDFYENNTALDGLYKGLKINKLDNYGNSQRIRAFKQAYMLSQMGGPRNRAHWDRSPFETNAYYNRGNNKITIPFAIMNSVFFGGNFTLLDYSRLGSLVGHEITHGFDNSGRVYDGNGVITNTWTEETVAAYQEKIKCFKRQYSSYFVNELNRTVDGALSLNENLADNAGVKLAYTAAKQFFNSFKMESEKFTPEQLFFIGFSTMYCSTETKSYVEYIMGRGYSPSNYRVIGSLSNMKEFSTAFNCSRGSVMNPTEKCSLW